MMTENTSAKHCNLYYIFAADKQANPMSLLKAEAIRNRIFSQPSPAS